MPYSSLVLQNFYERKNFGEVSPSPGILVGEGCASNDRVFIRFTIQVEDNRITVARYQCPSCVVAIAAGSQLAQMVEGMQLDEVINLSPEDLQKTLGGIPEERIDRCSIAITALKCAIEDFQIKRRDLK